MKWTDTHVLGRELAEKYPDIDPISVRLDDLNKWLCDMPAMAGKQTQPLLHAVHKAWIDETSSWHIDS
jgi:FeS assembly protein IscX